MTPEWKSHTVHNQLSILPLAFQCIEFLVKKPLYSSGHSSALWRSAGKIVRGGDRLHSRLWEHLLRVAHPGGSGGQTYSGADVNARHALGVFQQPILAPRNQAAQIGEVPAFQGRRRLYFVAFLVATAILQLYAVSVPGANSSSRLPGAVLVLTPVSYLRQSGRGPLKQRKDRFEGPGRGEMVVQVEIGVLDGGSSLVVIGSRDCAKADIFGAGTGLVLICIFVDNLQLQAWCLGKRRLGTGSISAMIQKTIGGPATGQDPVYLAGENDLDRNCQASLPWSCESMYLSVFPALSSGL